MGDRLATTDMGRKVAAVVPFAWGGNWVSILHKVAWAEAHLRAKGYRDPCSVSHLAATDMGRKSGGGLLYPFQGELDIHLTKRDLGRGLPS